jgi:hypothetical protein
MEHPLIVSFDARESLGPCRTVTTKKTYRIEASYVEVESDTKSIAKSTHADGEDDRAALPTVALSPSALPSELAARFPPPVGSYNFWQKVVNRNEPLTKASITEKSASKFAPLLFVNKIVLVDMNELIAHAKQRIKDKSSLTEMYLEFYLRDCQLADVQESYSLKSVHWARYIFPHSKSLQDMYAAVHGESKLVEFIREGQLDELQMDTDLLNLALECWIADLDDFTPEAQ